MTAARPRRKSRPSPASSAPRDHQRSGGSTPPARTQVRRGPASRATGHTPMSHGRREPSRACERSAAPGASKRSMSGGSRRRESPAREVGNTLADCDVPQVELQKREKEERPGRSLCRKALTTERAKAAASPILPDKLAENDAES